MWNIINYKTLQGEKQTLVQKANSFLNSYKKDNRSKGEGFFQAYLDINNKPVNFIDQDEIITSILSLTLPKINQTHTFFL